MPGNVSFTISVLTKNGENLPELQGRLNDLSPAFQAIIPEWADLNKQMFGQSRGMEGSGAQVDDSVFWDPLKTSTRKAKRRAGQPDQIMVATGDLMRALTSPDLVFQAVSAQEAMFGSPLDPEDAAKVGYNWSRRQAIFLSTFDQNAIRRIVKDYLSMGPGFEDKRFAEGLEAVMAGKEAAQMDMDFENSIAGDTGEF